MIEPSLYEKIYWASFNSFAKVFAYCQVFVSFIFVLIVVASMAGNSNGTQYSPWLLVLFIPLLVVGVLMIKAKPYYPEKLKEWYESKHTSV